MIFEKLSNAKEKKMQESRIDKNIRNLRATLRYYSMIMGFISVLLCSFITHYKVYNIVAGIVLVLSYIDIIDYVYLREIKHKMYNHYNQLTVNGLCTSIENKRFRLSKSYFVIMMISYIGLYLMLVTVIENYIYDII
jgi:hypothetical protein